MIAIDAITRPRLAGIAELAAAREAAGFDGLWITETNGDALLPAAVAAHATERITIGTAVALAFARTPMSLAYAAWELHCAAGGRFVLGLGPQIRPHIENRFSMPWSQPAARMREYVEALRAIWTSWREGTRLDFRGEFYTHTLMPPMFAPVASELPPPKVLLAAVGPAMTRVAGEVADGIVVHPFCSPHYVAEVMAPLVREAGARPGFELVVMPLVAVPEHSEEVRQRLAFYGSTPAYKPVLDAHGWGGLQPELHRLSKQGRWDDMAALVDDEMLDTLAVVAPAREMRARLLERWGGLAARIAPDFSYAGEVDPGVALA